MEIEGQQVTPQDAARRHLQPAMAEKSFGFR
jgi:hypothetical protein